MNAIIILTSSLQIRIFLRTLTVITHLGIATTDTGNSYQLETAVGIVPIGQGGDIEQIVQTTAPHFYLRIVNVRRQITHIHPQPESVDRSNPSAYKKMGVHSQIIPNVIARQQAVWFHTDRKEKMFIELITFKLLIGRPFLQHILQCTVILRL